MVGMIIQTRHNGISSWFSKGDDVSVEFSDGKGVSGQLAEVDIEPGGGVFRLVVTHDGQYPEPQNVTLHGRAEDEPIVVNVYAEPPVMGTTWNQAMDAPQRSQDEATGDVKGDTAGEVSERLLTQLGRAEKRLQIVRDQMGHERRQLLARIERQAERVRGLRANLNATREDNRELEERLAQEAVAHGQTKRDLERYQEMHENQVATMRDLRDQITRLSAQVIKGDDNPRLGLATNRQLLDELTTRIQVHGPGLDYRTVGSLSVGRFTGRTMQANVHIHNNGEGN